jgi:delta 1-pyrroline-5-carboxylate dehydrogenase
MKGLTNMTATTNNVPETEYILGHSDREFRLLINGRLVEGAGTLDVINPATGRTLTAAPRASGAQMNEAVAAAKAAFPMWSTRPLGERSALLIKLADAIESEQEPPSPATPTWPRLLSPTRR